MGKKNKKQKEIVYSYPGIDSMNSASRTGEARASTSTVCHQGLLGLVRTYRAWKKLKKMK